MSSDGHNGLARSKALTTGAGVPAGGAREPLPSARLPWAHRVGELPWVLEPLARWRSGSLLLAERSCVEDRSRT